MSNDHWKIYQWVHIWCKFQPRSIEINRGIWLLEARDLLLFVIAGKLKHNKIMGRVLV
jgi:hypothetical protein